MKTFTPIHETTVANSDLSHEKVKIFSKLTYQVWIMIKATTFFMRPMLSLEFTGALPSLVNDAYLRLHRASPIQHLLTPRLQTATKQWSWVVGFFPLNVQMAYLQTGTLFGVVENLAVDILLWLTFIDECIRGVMPLEWKIVPLKSGSVADYRWVTTQK